MKNPKNKIEKLIDDLDLSQYRKTIIDLLVPCVIASFNFEDNVPSLASSYSGGNPDLPKDMNWPTANGKPLNFLAQFNLNELNNFDINLCLPDEGLLSFFYDNNGSFVNSSSKVYIFSHSDNLTRKINQNEFDFLPHSAFSFHQVYSLPSSLEDVGLKIDPQSGLSYNDLYWSIISDFDAIYYHQIGGYTIGNHNILRQEKKPLLCEFSNVEDFFHFMVDTNNSHPMLGTLEVYYTQS